MASYDVRASKTRHLRIRAAGKVNEVGDLIKGACFTAARTNQEVTNTEDYRSKAHYFKSADVAGTGTVTILSSSEQDKQFTAIHNIQMAADEKEEPMVDLIYTDDATGENITLSDCIVQSLPQGSMDDAIPQIPWVFLATEYHRSFDGEPTDMDSAMNQ